MADAKESVDALIVKYKTKAKKLITDIKAAPEGTDTAKMKEDLAKCKANIAKLEKKKEEEGGGSAPATPAKTPDPSAAATPDTPAKPVDPAVQKFVDEMKKKEDEKAKLKAKYAQVQAKVKSTTGAEQEQWEAKLKGVKKEYEECGALIVKLKKKIDNGGVEEEEKPHAPAADGAAAGNKAELEAQKAKLKAQFAEIKAKVGATTGAEQAEWNAKLKVVKAQYEAVDAQLKSGALAVPGTATSEASTPGSTAAPGSKGKSDLEEQKKKLKAQYAQLKKDAAAATGAAAEDLQNKLKAVKAEYDAVEAKLKAPDGAHAEEPAVVHKGDIPTDPDTVSQIMRERDALQKKVDHLKLEVERVSKMDNDLETVNLDRDIALATAETLQIEVETMRLEMEQLQLDLELHKAKDKKPTKEDEAEAAKENPNIQRLFYKSMESQNKKLREALIQCREVSISDRDDFKKMIEALKQQLVELPAVKAELEKTKQALAAEKHEVQQVKEDLAVAQESVALVGTLSDQKRKADDELRELRLAVREWEELQKINDEMEETHLATEQQMAEDLDDRDRYISRLQDDILEMEKQAAERDNTIQQFRDLVHDYERELAGQGSDEVKARSMDLNRKSANLEVSVGLQKQVREQHAKMLSRSLLQLEANQNADRVHYYETFLADSFDAERDAVEMLLLLGRLRGKSAVIIQHFAEVYNFSERRKGSLAVRDDELASIARVRKVLIELEFRANSLLTAMSNADLEVYHQIGSHAKELLKMSEKVEALVQLVQHEELSEQTDLSGTEAVTDKLKDIRIHAVPAHDEPTWRILKVLFQELEVAGDFLLVQARRVESEMRLGVDPDGKQGPMAGGEPLRPLYGTLTEIREECGGLGDVCRKFLRKMGEGKYALPNEVNKNLHASKDSSTKALSSLSRIRAELHDRVNEATVAIPPDKMAAQVDKIAQAKLGENATLDTLLDTICTIRNHAENAQTALLGGEYDVKEDPNATEVEKPPPPWEVRGVAIRAQIREAEGLQGKVERSHAELTERVKELRQKEFTLQEEKTKTEVLTKRIALFQEDVAKMGELQELVQRLKDEDARSKEALDTLRTEKENLEKKLRAGGAVATARAGTPPPATPTPGSPANSSPAIPAVGTPGHAAGEKANPPSPATPNKTTSLLEKLAARGQKAVSPNQSFGNTASRLPVHAAPAASTEDASTMGEALKYLREENLRLKADMVSAKMRELQLRPIKAAFMSHLAPNAPETPVPKRDLSKPTLEDCRREVASLLKETSTTVAMPAVVDLSNKAARPATEQWNVSSAALDALRTREAELEAKVRTALVAQGSGTAVVGAFADFPSPALTKNLKAEGESLLARVRIPLPNAGARSGLEQLLPTNTCRVKVRDDDFRRMHVALVR